jgi:CheY-like chemotaxis protein
VDFTCRILPARQPACQEKIDLHSTRYLKIWTEWRHSCQFAAHRWQTALYGGAANVSATMRITHNPTRLLIKAVTDASSPVRPLALVVEDDEQIGQLIKFIVERQGFDVTFARDGRAAQQLIGSAPAPAIAILDIMLPFIDGFQLIGKIREHAQWKNCPIIMLTAKSQEKDIVRALDAGANDYMVKPFLPEELRARIRRLVKQPMG